MKNKIKFLIGLILLGLVIYGGYAHYKETQAVKQQVVSNSQAIQQIVDFINKAVAQQNGQNVVQ